MTSVKRFVPQTWALQLLQSGTFVGGGVITAGANLASKNTVHRSIFFARTSTSHIKRSISQSQSHRSRPHIGVDRSIRAQIVLIRRALVSGMLLVRASVRFWFWFCCVYMTKGLSTQEFYVHPLHYQTLKSTVSRSSVPPWAVCNICACGPSVSL